MTPALPTHLCRGLDLGQSLSLLESSLLLESQNLEAVKVGKTLPPCDLVSLLGPVGLLPLGVDLGLLPQLLDGAGSGAADETLNAQGREEDLGEGDGLAGGGEFGL